MKMKSLFTSFLLITILLFPFITWAFEGRVVHIADGDTITVLTHESQQVKIRLYGIDCPERKQAFGRRAQEFTKNRVANQIVNVQVMDTDHYGRTVGIVRFQDGNNLHNLNEELLSNGLAWHYSQYCKAEFCTEWKNHEMRARQKQLGLWKDKQPVEPWNFRKMNRRK